MKKSMLAISLAVVLVASGVGFANASYDAVYQGPSMFFYDTGPYGGGTYGDWSKIGSSGYESYLNVQTPGAVSMGLKISTVATQVIPAGTWAGFQWSVPASATQIINGNTVNTAGWKINQYQVNGWNTFPVDPGYAKVYLVDGSWNGASDPVAGGHVLWEQTVAGYLPNTWDTLTHASSTLRFIVYVPQDVQLFDTSYVQAGAVSMSMRTVTPEPATLMLLGLGGLVLRRKVRKA